MVAPMVAAKFLKSEPSRLRGYQAAVTLLAVYVVLCVASHARAESLAREDLARKNLHPDSLKVFPEPLGPHRFRSAARVGDDWILSLWHVPGGSADSCGTIHTDESAPRVAELRATPAGRALVRFMAAPVWELRPDGRVEVHDLRFDSVVVPRKGTFVVEFPPGSMEPALRSGSGRP